MVNFFQDPPRLAPPYSIARLAGIETDEKLEEKEVKEGGGEERVDSSESDEPKVKITISSWLNCALRDDEAVYWASIGHYETVAVSNW